MERMEFCSRLKTARIEAGLKQQDVAKVMDVPISTISVIESGIRKLDVMELIQLAKMYNKPVEWFFRNKEGIQSRRWYDREPLSAEALDLFRKAPIKVQKSVASAVIAFLKTGDIFK